MTLRVILVGPVRERARLRARAHERFLVVGESPDLASARSSNLEADAFLVAPPSANLAGPLVEPLTEREVQVLGLLAEGLSNKAIAARLGIGDQTVKFHVASISGKLGAHNRTEAVRLAVRLGLITL